MPYSFNNYVNDFVNQLSIDYEFTKDVNSILDRHKTINLSLNIHFGYLENQAYTFADNAIAMPDSIDFKIPFGNRSDVWRDKLAQLYILSYYRAVLIGLTSDSIPIDEDDVTCNCVFPGHGIFMHMLMKRRFTYRSDGSDEYSVTINLNLDTTHEKIESLIKGFEERFPFLVRSVEYRNYKIRVFNSELDAMFSRLMVTVLKVKGGSRFPETANLTENQVADTVVDKKYRFSIYDVKSLKLVEFISKESNALGTGIFSANMKRFLYLPTSRPRQELSAFICRANFICMEDSGPDFGINNIYIEVSREIEEDVLIHKDVEAITMLKCSPRGYFSKEPKAKKRKEEGEDQPLESFSMGK